MVILTPSTLDPGEFLDAGKIDQVGQRGQAQLRRRDQTLPAGEQLGIAAFGQRCAAGSGARCGTAKSRLNYDFDQTRRQPAKPYSCTPLVSAPSTTRLVPLMKLAAGLAMNTAAFAISCGVPIRPVGFIPSATL